MRYTLIAVLVFFSFFDVHAQQQPKLVIGIVIDQMRQDYIYRYGSRFSDSGFKRVINGGYMFENARFDYVPTYTGPGHASIYTGTTPAIHGIVANDWYSRKNGWSMYCVDDNAYEDVGGRGKGKSPKNLKTTTITDQLQIATMFRSKVVGFSLKDRGAVLPAGHSANGAYWFDTKTGAFTTSTFYMPQLPQWMQDFNNKKLSDTYLGQKWETLFPIGTYTASAVDNNNYENPLGKDSLPVFPHDLNRYKADKAYAVLSYTPYGNQLLAEAGKAAIEGEHMGKDEITDFLCLSFSATDYAGHSFGPQAIEVEDMYLRLDRQLAEFFGYLDKIVGKDRWTVFITADHGGNDVPAFLADHRIPAGLLKDKEVEHDVKVALMDKFGDSLVLSFENEQFYLDTAQLKRLNLNACEVQEIVGKTAATFPGIARYYTACDFSRGIVGPLDVEQFLYRGWNPKESGDVILLTEPGWMDYGPKGTSHGSPWPYDTRVPVLFYGAGIKKGSSATQISVTDIAPTLAILLNIQFPNGCIGKPLDIIVR